MPWLTEPTATVRFQLLTIHSNTSDNLSVSSFTIDTTAPTLDNVTIASNNTLNTTLAKTNDNITLSITSSEAIQTPSVSIAGQAAQVTSNDGITWQGLYTMTNSNTQGPVSLNIVGFMDTAGNRGEDYFSLGSVQVVDTSAGGGTNTCSSGGGTNTGSPPGTLATQAADFTVISADAIDITSGTTISSTGGTFTFADGFSINGATISLQDTTLAVGETFSNTGDNLTMSGGTGLKLLSDLSLSSNSAVTFDSYQPNGLNLVLSDNSTGNISLGTITLDSENIEVLGGTLSLAGGSVGANGLIEVGEQGNLSLQGNLAVAGTLDLNDGANLNLANNATANLSGGKLELAGSHGLDGITTDNATTLQINSSGSISRTDNGTSTVGNLVLSQAGSSSGVSFGVDNMSLTVGGTAQFGGDNITLNSASLHFQSSPTFDNGSSVDVSNGELILQSGATINDSSLDFTSSTFKPSGTVSLTGSSHFTFDSGSSVMLEGDSALSQSGSVTWPSPDLNGNALTLNVDNMTLNGAQSIGTGESLSSGSSNLYLNDNLTIDNGAHFHLTTAP